MEKVAFTFSLLCWGAFYVFWVVAAFKIKRTAKRESVAGSFSYRLPAVLAFLLLVNAQVFPAPLSTIVIGQGDGLSLVAMACSLAGLAICLWARLALGRNWSSIVVVKVDHELVQSGPYRHVRHPIYTGMLLMFLANVLLSGRVGGCLGFVLLAVSFGMKLLKEEQFMLKEFPESYPAYMKRVKRLIPYIL
jgi:protein-S-isoprenylcysteine O-methyltransferase Ste14